MKSEFASPERASDAQLTSDIEKTKDLPLVKDLTQLVSDAFVILNHQRQIVYCNSLLMEALGVQQPEELYGKRLGEAFNCIHAKKTDAGCGTTDSCKLCGAVAAILNSQDQINSLQQEECRLTAGDENESFDFLIRAKTLDLMDEPFTLLFVRDIGNEKRKQVLERIFFHDLINTAGGIQGLMELLREADEDERKEFIELAEISSQTLIEEINAQKDLIAAENNHLGLEMSELNSLDIVSSVVAIYKNHKVARGKTIQADKETVSIDFASDPRLLIRIIGNMSKNALEAESSGQTITVGARHEKNQLRFWVQNPSAMPEASKMQMFQRSFSTKGTGRGIGTYSIKLLGEKYLKGTVSFNSDETSGTCFSITLPVNR